MSRQNCFLQSLLRFLNRSPSSLKYQCFYGKPRVVHYFTDILSFITKIVTIPCSAGWNRNEIKLLQYLKECHWANQRPLANTVQKILTNWALVEEITHFTPSSDLMLWKYPLIPQENIYYSILCAGVWARAFGHNINECIRLVPYTLKCAVPN